MTNKGQGYGGVGHGRRRGVQGQGRRQGTGGRPGRMGGSALGPGGNCVCPVCGTKVAHQQGVPCNQMTCPKCAAPMTRE